MTLAPYMWNSLPEPYFTSTGAISILVYEAGNTPPTHGYHMKVT